MELGLTLGDVAPKPSGVLPESSSPSTPRKSTSRKSTGLDFCMDLRLSSHPVNPQKSDEETDDDELDDADQDSESDFNRDGSESAPPVQLNLLPVAPVPRRISPNFFALARSSDNNACSENCPSPPATGLDMNRLPASTVAGHETASLTNGGVFVLYGNAGGENLQMCADNKRSAFEANANDVVEGDKTTSSRASDDDENGPNSRKKLRLSKEQSAFLEESFKEHHTLNPKQKLALAKELNLRPRQVEVWFQNRRARTKLKQTEVDCEYLKRCCETLTEENRRLQKELQELRALKASSSPFYAQLPATTLTMCPSCERVATAAPPPATKGAPIPVLYPFSQAPAHPSRPAASS